ncbi:MAG: hypothetical protein NW226_11165 [Microscillaceae bacterium]|nr:hypothetical protein [Microscillaceae bacterium]
MKVLNIISVIMIIINLVACKKSNNKPLLNDIFNPPFNIDYDFLVNQGFKLQTGLPGVDVPILAKNFGDTLVYFQFDFIGEKIGQTPLCMFKRFKVASVNLKELKDSLYTRNILILNNINCINLMKGFYIKNNINKLFFHCSVDEDTKGGINFYLRFDYPELH